MKSTGMIKRIDDLGRIVIPKEIRKSLRILENDMLEIYVREQEIVLKKYSNFLNIKNHIQKILDIFYNIYKFEIFISDSSTIISYSGKYKKEYLNKEISSFLIDCIKNRKTFCEEQAKTFKLLESGSELNSNYFIVPLFNFGDIHGLLVIFQYNIGSKINEIGNIIKKTLELELEG